MAARPSDHQHWFAAQDVEGTYQLLEALLRDREMQQLLGVNRYQGVLWFNQQSFERLLWWLLLLAVVVVSAEPGRTAAERAETIGACYDTTRYLREAAGRARYRVDTLLESTRPATIEGGVKV